MFTSSKISICSNISAVQGIFSTPLVDCFTKYLLLNDRTNKNSETLPTHCSQGMILNTKHELCDATMIYKNEKAINITGSLYHLYINYNLFTRIMVDKYKIKPS